MDGKKQKQNIINPHDKIFREVMSNLENACSVLQNLLPGNVLGLMELSTLEICKDSFVEKELADYYSDMLYRVVLSGAPGYVYDCSSIRAIMTDMSIFSSSNTW